MEKCMENPWSHSINTTLTLIDKGMCDLVKSISLDSLGNRGVLHTTVNDLTLAQCEKLEILFGDTRRLLQEMKERLCLSGKTENISSQIRGWSWGMRVPVVELGPQYLKAYGGIPPEFSDWLEKCTQKLENLLMMIAEVSSQAGKDIIEDNDFSQKAI